MINDKPIDIIIFSMFVRLKIMRNRGLEFSAAGIINKISEAAGSITEDQLLLTSKTLAHTVQTNPLIIKSGGYVFNKRLFEKLTDFPHPENQDRIIDLPFIKFSKDAAGNIHQVVFHEDFYKKNQLICQMMEDEKGFRALLERIHPNECKSTKPSFMRRIAQGVLGGVVGLLASVVAFSIIFPPATVMFLLYVAAATKGAKCNPMKLEGGYFFSPLSIFYSTFQGAHLSYHSAKPLPISTLVTNAIKGSFSTMWRMCFSRRLPDLVEVDFKNPWSELKAEYNRKTFCDIALDWRKKHKKPNIALPPTNLVHYSFSHSDNIITEQLERSSASQNVRFDKPPQEKTITSHHSTSDLRQPLLSYVDQPIVTRHKNDAFLDRVTQAAKHAFLEKQKDAGLSNSRV